MTSQMKSQMTFPNSISQIRFPNAKFDFDFDADTCRDKGPQIWRLLSGFGDTQGSLSGFEYASKYTFGFVFGDFEYRDSTPFRTSSIVTRLHLGLRVS